MNKHIIINRAGRRLAAVLVALILAILPLAACGGAGEHKDAWLEGAALDANETKEELYRKALEEDVPVIYTISTRVTKVKEAFEAEYPGLYLEVRDLRSPDLIDEVLGNYESGHTDCDVVLCNDNSGEFKEKLVDTGVVVPYLPDDIAAHMKEGIKDGMVPFIYETMMCFYNSAKYDSSPEDNIWALTDTRYKGKIYMPNPLRSFSTYVLCASSMKLSDELEEAYVEYTGKKFGEADASDPEGEGISGTAATHVNSLSGGSDGRDIAKAFWEEISKNIVFTNSSDEVVEALGNGDADFGFMVSSKMRLKDIGYSFEPVWKMKPFTGCMTSYSVMIARNSKCVNSAKLFIRFLLGETDGTGEGYKPFSLPGTWSARTDVPDATDVRLDEIDLISPDTEDMIDRRSEMEKFWTQILQGNLSAGE